MSAMGRVDTGRAHATRDRWVVKVSGGAVDAPQEHRALWETLARAAPRADLVLVHGGGRAVDAMLDRLGMVSERVEGLRRTPTEQMGVVAGVLSGTMNKALVSALLGAGCAGVGLSLADGGMVDARILGDGSLGRVGEVVGGRAGLLRTLLDAGYVPVLSSIARADDGGLVNVNADDAAAGVAAILGARGLVLLSDVAGVRDARGNVIAELDETSCERLIADGVVRDGMIAKVRAALRASSTSGASVLIASYLDHGALAALLDGRPREHAGTWILAPARSAHAAGKGGRNIADAAQTGGTP